MTPLYTAYHFSFLVHDELTISSDKVSSPGPSSGPPQSLSELPSALTQCNGQSQ